VGAAAAALHARAQPPLLRLALRRGAAEAAEQAVRAAEAAGAAALRAAEAAEAALARRAAAELVLEPVPLAGQRVAVRIHPRGLGGGSGGGGAGGANGAAGQRWAQRVSLGSSEQRAAASGCEQAPPRCAVN
jgi:hypothetical protein